MAKISQLLDGAPALVGDEFPIARAGGLPRKLALDDALAVVGSLPSGAPAVGTDAILIARAGVAKKLTLTEIQALLSADTTPRPENLLINGFFDVWPEGTSFTNQTTVASFYTAECWGGNRAGNVNGQSIARFDITGSTRAFARPLGRHGLLWTRAAGNTDTSAMYQFYALTSHDSIRLAGKEVTFTLICYKGANYSGGNLAITLSYGTGSDQREYSFTGRAVAATTSTALSASVAAYQVTGTIPTTATQVGIQMSWSPTGTAGAVDGIYLCAATLQYGDGAAYIHPRPLAQEESLCEVFFEKSFARATAPAQNLGASQATLFSQVVGASAGQYFNTIPFRTRKRIAPTMTLYNPSAANGQIRNFVTATDCSATAVGTVTETGVQLTANSPAGSAIGHLLGVCWTANARL